MADSLRSTIGPFGRDKILVDDGGMYVVTNDGYTIVIEMDIDDPIGEMIREAARTQHDIVADGTSTVVVLAGDLLVKAGELRDLGVSSTTIQEGYQLAASKARESLSDVAIPISSDDREILLLIAKTTMSGRLIDSTENFLSDLAVQTVETVSAEGEIDLEMIKTLRLRGDSITDSFLIKGAIVESESVHEEMPKRIEGAKVALVDSDVSTESGRKDITARPGNSSEYLSFNDARFDQVQDWIDHVQSLGVEFVVSSGQILDDPIRQMFSNAGILAIELVNEDSEMERIKRATGANIVTHLSMIGEEDLGHAELIDYREVTGDGLIFVENDAARSAAVVCRGGTRYTVDEVERIVKDATAAVSMAIEGGSVLPSAGAVEVEIARELRDYSLTLDDRRQLVIEEFADVIEGIPRTLATSAGMDPILALSDVRKAHHNGNPTTGLDVIEGEVTDVMDVGVIEPTLVKSNAINLATEVSSLLVGIDDVFTAESLSDSFSGTDIWDSE